MIETMIGMSRLLVITAAVTGMCVTGCDQFEKICAGPCVKADICGTSLPLSWLSWLGWRGGADRPDMPCGDACKEFLSWTPDECQRSAYAALDCFSQLSCDDLAQSTMVAYGCGAAGVEVLNCADDFATRCCRPDDPCGLEDNRSCECCYQYWDLSDCLDPAQAAGGCYHGDMGLRGAELAPDSPSQRDIP